MKRSLHMKELSLTNSREQHRGSVGLT